MVPVESSCRTVEPTVAVLSYTYVYCRILSNCHTVDTVELSQYCRLLSNTTVELSNRGSAENCTKGCLQHAGALASSNMETRLSALAAIGSYGPAAASAVACRLGDDEPTIRAEADQVLQQMDDVSGAASSFSRLLKAESSDVRRRAVAWLGECGDEALYFIRIGRESTCDAYHIISAATFSRSLQRRAVDGDLMAARLVFT